MIMPRGSELLMPARPLFIALSLLVALLANLLPLVRAPRGSSPMTASAVMDLPEPDSPTIPRVSWGRRAKVLLLANFLQGRWKKQWRVPGCWHRL